VAPAEVSFSQTGGLPADIGNSCKLWRRDPLAHGPLWQSLDNSDEVVPGLQSEVAFTTGNQVTQAGQFWLEVPGAARNTIQTRSGEQTINFEFRVFPNPVSSRGSLQLTSDSQEPCVFRLFNEKGQQVRKTEFLAAGTLQLSDLPAGVYAYRVENGQFMRFGKLVVE
ncbi:MAG: Secretion system C-terminal sorting domain, partial [Bacteroidota bacterium]